MPIKHIWSGNFLDAKLGIFCEEEQATIIHYKITSYDIEIEGTIPEPNYEGATPRQKMEMILASIQETYIDAVLHVKEAQIKNHGFCVH